MEIIREEILTNVTIMMGAYGDMEDCVGIVEKCVSVDGKGVYTQLQGCSYLYKGYPNREIVKALNVPKNMVSQIFTAIHSIPIFIQLICIPFLLFLWLVAKKVLINIIGIYANAINGPLSEYKIEEFSKPMREINRVAGVIVGQIKNPKLRHSIEEILRFVCLAIEYDAAYRFPLQDLLMEFDVKKLKEAPVKEFKRVIDIFIERTQSAKQKKRWTKLKKLIVILLRVSKKARRILLEFVVNLRMDMVKLDEADFFFSLKRKRYNVRGLSLEKRLEIREDINKSKDHDIPNVNVERATGNVIRRWIT